MCFDQVIIRTDSRLAPCQLEMSLQSNAISHWLGANLESVLIINIQQIYFQLSCHFPDNKDVIDSEYGGNCEGFVDFT